jgi:hypothetical protein
MSAIFNQAKAYCQAGYQAAKEVVTSGVQYANENPKTCAKVAAYAISALATIGTIALVGTAIASFAAAAIFPGTITVCFAVFVGVIAHDSFRIAQNIAKYNPPSVEVAAATGGLMAGARALGSQAATLARGALAEATHAVSGKEGTTAFSNAILKGTIASKIPGVPRLLGPVFEELNH